MTGKRRGALTLLENSMKDDGHNHELLKVHCIIHQEALCAKHVTMKEVMETVVKTVNFIRSRALNHRQFQQLLQEMNSEYGDLLYLPEVRWLSRGATLERFNQVRSEIDIFLREKDFAHCEISDPEWISNLAFLVDITKHLNTLNLQLQGRIQLINVLHERICAFELKFCLWEAQLKSRNFTHFPHLIENQPKDIALHVSYVSDLRSQFENRFSDLRNMSQHSDYSEIQWTLKSQTPQNIYKWN